MTQTIEIGSAPYNEQCVQFGSEDYEIRVKKECIAFINQIKRHYGNPPEGTKLRILSSPYNDGRYYEVGFKPDSDSLEYFKYVKDVESDSKSVLATWDAEALLELSPAPSAPKVMITNRGLPLCCLLAREVWQSSGERTIARLNDLVEHYARVYGLTAQLPDLQKQAANSIPSWQLDSTSV